MNRKCCFVILYFGEFPSYYELFLKSCKFNKEYDWLVVTDNAKKYEYPQNVHILQMSFKKLKKLFNEKLGFEVTINSYHKLCDYKPAYGFIFEKELENYNFWGYCDLDLLFGNLNNFITDDMLNSYDKLFCLGHFTMFKNTYENNRIFLKEYKGELLYKKVFTTEKTMIFDEPYGIGRGSCINDMFMYYDKKIYMEDFSLNLTIAPANIVRAKYDVKENIFKNIKYRNSIFLWRKGNLYRVYVKNKNILKEEFNYIHFQSRDMKMEANILKEDTIKILGDGFYTLENNNINLNNFSKIKKRIISLRYFKKMYRWKVNGIKRKFSGVLKKYEN